MIPAGTGLDFHKERKLSRSSVSNNISLDDSNVESNEDIMQKEMAEALSEEKGLNAE